MDTELFTLANQFVAQSWWVFFRAIDSVELTWTLASMALVGMWFAGAPATQNAYIQRLGKTYKDQTDVRVHVVALFGSMATAFLLARVLQHLAPRPRPMLTATMKVPIDHAIWSDIKSSISTQGSFPSDHAVMWFALVVGLFWLNRTAGLVALGGGLIASVLRVGTGFHWPSDILGGAALGIFVTIIVFWSLRRISAFHALLVWVTALFERYPIVMYTIGFLVVMDFSRKFSGMFGFLSIILGKQISH